MNEHYQRGELNLKKQLIKNVDVIKKTVYLEKELIKQLKLKAVMEESTESKTLNKILTEYFVGKEN